MARINAKNTLAAVALAAATFATPTLAHAGNYSSSARHDCETNTEEQVLAGAIGAVLGGVLGSQTAGNGARTEGSVLGAVLGGAAGAAIADGNNDCDKIKKRRSTSSYGYDRTGSRTVYTSPRVQTVHHTGYNNRGYNRNRGYNHNRGYSNTSYGYNNRSYRNDPVDRINRRMDRLRSERAELKDRQRYEYRRWIDRRLDEIGYELAELKQKKRRVKKRERRRADRHYHNSNVCYDYH